MAVGPRPRSLDYSGRGALVQTKPKTRLHNETAWLTQLRLSRNINIEKMSARTRPHPQGNVESASTLTDATLLVGRGASAPSRRDDPLPWLKLVCHSLNQLPHPPKRFHFHLGIVPNAPAPSNEINGFSSISRELSFPLLFNPTSSIMPGQPLAQTASQV